MAKCKAGNSHFLTQLSRTDKVGIIHYCAVCDRYWRESPQFILEKLKVGIGWCGSCRSYHKGVYFSKFAYRSKWFCLTCHCSWYSNLVFTPDESLNDVLRNSFSLDNIRR